MFITDIATQLSGAFSGPFSTTTEYIVGGYYQPGDGGGGTFVWVVPGITLPPDDGGIVIHNANDTSGYFMRIYSGPINVRWFGAITVLPDGTTQNTEVTAFVHAARDSEAFANNGTLYFPKGEYPGAFEFAYVNVNHNEFSLIGDGIGSVLRTNGLGDPEGHGYPVLRLGFRRPNWDWAKVSNLFIDGWSGGERWSDGVVYDQANLSWHTSQSGRWIFDRVTFNGCDRGVYKPNGNIGNHYIDCHWVGNNYGVYAHGNPEQMHYGCDRYTGGCFDGSVIAGLYYEDSNPLKTGQIIVDGTVLQQNPGWGIYVSCTDKARMLWASISLRNIWFEQNGTEDEGGDIFLEGVRSVRIDDTGIEKMRLIESSVNLFNCRHETEHNPGYPYQLITVDSASSLVAYEHRFMGYPSDKIFVNSISYDGTEDINQQAWQPSSVWGPLRAVVSTKELIVMTWQFDLPGFGENWDNVIGGGLALTSTFDTKHVLGNGSNRLQMSGNMHIYNTFVIGIISLPAYYVWSIHTYLEESSDLREEELYGEIVSDDGALRLGTVFFKKGQWACSYGMKYLTPWQQFNMRLQFRTINATSANFCIADYQIVIFNTLAGANAFVNSREFAIPQPEESRTFFRQ